MSPDIFNDLMAVIEDRKQEMPEGSYTTTLFSKGIDNIGEKIIEEASELVEAGNRRLNSTPHRRSCYCQKLVIA